jgi:hypothetical protein
LLCVYSCAQYTSVSRGSGSSLLKLDHMVGGSPSKRRPQPSANSVSPSKEVGATNAKQRFGAHLM